MVEWPPTTTITSTSLATVWLNHPLTFDRRNGQTPPLMASRFSSDDDPNVLLDILFKNRDVISEEDFEANNDPANDSTLDRLFLFDFIIGIILAIVTLSTVIGNALVIAAILRERHLRSVGNYLVFSLAVADLMVACLVMPLGALYVVTGKWTLGAAFCDLWTVADVLCCTASILHLLAIAVVSKQANPTLSHSISPQIARFAPGYYTPPLYSNTIIITSQLYN